MRQRSLFPWIVLSFVLICIVLYACSGPAQQQTTAPAPAPRTVTISGRDETGQLIDPVNLWEKATDDRGKRVGIVHDNEQVSLLEQRGIACHIRTATGVEGWLTCRNFIRELK